MKHNDTMTGEKDIAEAYIDYWKLYYSELIKAAILSATDEVTE